MADFLKEGRPPGTETDPAVERTVADMLARIRDEGEPAVRAYSRDLDGHDPSDFQVDQDTIARAEAAIDPGLRASIDLAHEHVRAFARAQRATLTDLEVEHPDGVVLGHRLVPVDSVGAYIPGGRYQLISSALMSIATARVAGVRHIAAMSAPQRDGSIGAATLYAMHVAGADAIYALGGVQAMGAMAFGALPGLDAVDMIVGAGNAYVAEAKRQLHGRVGIDLLAGPTEVLVIADDTADPRVVAIDLMAQAEHGPNSPAILITTSRALGERVIELVPQVVADWPTADTALAAWDALGSVALVESREEAARLSDEYAPEHLQIQVEDTGWYEEALRNYGTLFVGPTTTVAYGDKAVGTNHTLPTNGCARYTGGLWVGSYIKTLTFQRLTPAASAALAPHVAAISHAEGLYGHAVSAEIRATP